LQDELSRCEELIVSEAEKLQAKDNPHWFSLTFSKAYENGFIPDAFYKYMNNDVQEECRAYLQNLFYKIKQLKQYDRGKSILTLSLATHFILGILVVQLLIAL